jgi:hypothetical protein
MIAVSELKDQRAIDAANFVVREWIKSAGLEAMALWQAIDKVTNTQGPAEASVADPKVCDPAVVAKLSREMLEVFLDGRPPGTGPNYRKWAQQGIRQVTDAHGQVVEPVSALITGTILIGLVLAARIKKVKKDGVEFYPGLPNLSKIVAAASSMASTLN